MPDPGDAELAVFCPRDAADLAAGPHRVILLIPDHELDGAPGGAPGYRISIHCHTGDYGVSSPWSGITIPGTPALLPIATTACIVDDLSFGPYGRLSVSRDATRGTTVTITGERQNSIDHAHVCGERGARPLSRTDRAAQRLGSMRYFAPVARRA